MNEMFIWLSGHRFIDREIFNGQKFFPNFTENNRAPGDRKKYNMPDVNWLRPNKGIKLLLLDVVTDDKDLAFRSVLIARDHAQNRLVKTKCQTFIPIHKCLYRFHFQNVNNLNFF